MRHSKLSVELLENRLLLAADLVVAHGMLSTAEVGSPDTQQITIQNVGDESAENVIIRSQLSNQLDEPAWVRTASFLEHERPASKRPILSDELHIRSTHIGDINGDGWTDVAVDHAYVVFGREQMPSDISETSLDGTNGFTLRSADFVGDPVALGDINGDAIDDVAFGARVVFGSSDVGETGTFNLDNLHGEKGFVAVGMKNLTPIGDINGDGLVDLSAVHWSQFNTFTAPTYLILGSRTIGSTGTSPPDDITSGSVTGLQVTSEPMDPIVGIEGIADVVGIGDINSDGFDDIYFERFKGYSDGYLAGTVVFGHEGLTESPLNVAQISVGEGFSIRGLGRSGIDLYTRSVGTKAGDINADGFDDFLITYQPSSSNCGCTASSQETLQNKVVAALIFGGSELEAELFFEPEDSGFETFEYSKPYLDSHFEIARAEDVNFDGIQDQIRFNGEIVYSRPITGAPVDGSGDILETVTIPPGGSLTYTASGTVLENSTSIVTTAAPPIDQLREKLSDNVAPRQSAVYLDLKVEEPTINEASAFFEISITNYGPDTANNVSVVSDLTGALENATWALGPDFLTPGQVGSINATVDIPVGATVQVRVTGDLPQDYDGLFGMATVSVGPDQVALNNSATLFEQQRLLTIELAQEFGPQNAGDVDVGDLDGDGELDVFFSVSDGPNEVWLNHNANFVQSSDEFPDLASIYSAIANIDDDQQLEVISAGPSGIGVQVWNNLSNAPRRTTVLSNLNPAAHSIDVALADLNADGHLDLFVANAEQTPNWVFFGSDRGFQSSNQSLGSASSKSVELGDLDGDGDIDAVVANVDPNGGEGHNAIWINNGSGIFERGGAFGPGGEHIALGDLDNDGDLDLVGAQVGPNRIWLNNGRGGFTESPQQLLDGVTSHIALGDIDADGDLDIVVANWTNEANRIWLNEGDAHFIDSGLRLDTDARSEHIALADIDGDQDLDILVAVQGGPNKLYLNYVLQDIDPAANTVSEAADIGASVGVRFDLNGSDVSYELARDAEGKFTIDSESGVVSVAQHLNFEDSTAHEIEVVVHRGQKVITAQVSIQVLDVLEPTVSVSAIDIVSESDDFQRIVVEYAGSRINRATIGDDDIEVILPNGTTVIPTYYKARNFNLDLFTAVYRLDPPGGTWDSADNGTYRVNIRSREIANQFGGYLDSGFVEEFVVDIATENFLPADLDKSGEVGFSDFLILSSNFGKQVTAVEGDINSDGIVDFTDFLLFAEEFASRSSL